jgi:CRISPR-associated protein Csb2
LPVRVAKRMGRTAMTLVLEIEYLSGVAFAAIGPDSPIPDWPPQPDRIFSALVAAWASRGERDEEQQALKWLEKLQPPLIHASPAEPRRGVTVFVPPNDPRSDRQKHAKGVLPALRSRQPRISGFPASRPHESVVRFVWPEAAPGSEILASLQLLARDTAYIGHSASLTRCRFLLDHAASGLNEARPSERRVYDGRFAELRRTFEAGRRPLAGARVAPARDALPARMNVFGARWLILEHVAGDMPDIRACAVVAKTIRGALLSGYPRLGLGDAIPEVISGHTSDGQPTRAPHIAVVPLSFTGFPHADGHGIGFALIPPRDSAILNDHDFRKVLRTLAPIDDNQGRRILTITTKEGTAADRAFSIDLSPTFEPPAGRRSLDPALYVARAQSFATVTPIALDRHLKEDGEARQDEIKAQIVDACRNIGLPEAEEVVADKHSALEGAPSACPSRRSPAWMRWRLPPSLASRQLTHAVLRFSEPVDGPVILGAGRFLGLGLCRPIDLEGGHALR